MMRRLCPRRLGSFVQANSQRLLLLLSLALLVLCAAINSAKLDTDLASWIQRTSRIDNELQAINSEIGEGAGTNSLLILQTPKQSKQQHQLENDILSVESMMIHLEALAIATHVTIDLFDVSWSLKDVCFSPTLPDYEGMLVNQMLDHLMPCAIKTPLDCFWEGSKLMGPEQEVRMSSIGPKLKWTNLNPLLMVEAKRRAHPHASFPYDALISWMKRTGISVGYQDRPCLDPSDPNCPASAPNKLSGEAPNVAVELTRGCHGLAAKQMHWKEEEIVGGVVHNTTGYIVRASALQSTIQLMGERDVYDYWRKTTKVQDINNWSTEKAKLVLNMWQKRFKEELSQFMRTSVASSLYKIHALTPESMLEPVNSGAILDLTNFKLTVALLTIATCFLFPALGEGKKSSNNNDRHNRAESCQTEVGSDGLETTENHKQISRIKLILLAVLTSIIVTLTFVASLGLSSFMNLPFNMLTTQVLPPLALYYGFRQALMIANTYSRHYQAVPITHLTTECLNELLPVILMESTTLLVPLVVASVLPVQATRVFTFQAITYIVLSTTTAILLVPALLISFLVHSTGDGELCGATDKSTIYVTYKSSSNLRSKRSSSPGILSIKAKKSVRCEQRGEEPTLEDFIFSRLQEDLRYIRADSQQPTAINFSAQLRPEGLSTSFKVTTSRHPTASQSRQPSSANMTTNQMLQDQQQQQEVAPTSELPDLLQWPVKSKEIEANQNDLVSGCEKYSDTTSGDGDCDKEEKDQANFRSLIHRCSSSITSNRCVQFLVCLSSLVVLVILVLQSSSVKYGLQLRDIVLSGSVDYDSLMMREKFFPVYNIFIITGDEFDYAVNQRLLYEFHRRVEQVDGVVSGEGEKSTANNPEGKSKFWLMYFRDWLIELQDSFDLDRNRSAISTEGWSPDASDASRLAYKLLAQTGRLDNPIDKKLVETNRLVDKNGIINQRAFYYYLTAWVMNDAFTYSNSEANFRPEPKTWNENVEDLRIERARPLTYAQMPFLLKLSEDGDGLRTIIELRSISQAFAQLGLGNFPTGIPFIFWDQFINLDLLFIGTFLVVMIVYISLACLILTNLSLSLILVGPVVMTILQLYSLLGVFSLEFNAIVAVILLSSMGTSIIQSIHFTQSFHHKTGDLTTKFDQSFESCIRMMSTGLILLMISACVFRASKIDFMIKYSLVLFCLVAMNWFNSLVLTPVLLAIFNPRNDEHCNEEIATKANSNRDISKIVKTQRDKTTVGCKQIGSSSSKKRRIFPRVQSEISLSTISEEPHSEARGHDLKLDFSIRC